MASEGTTSQEQGDESAGRGLAFEQFARLHLLVGLAPEDELSVYAGEDARIINADGVATYWQMKHSTRPTIDKNTLRDFFEKADVRLAADPRTRVMLITSTPLSAGAADEVKRLAGVYGERFGARVWPMSPERPMESVREVIAERVRSEFPGSGIGSLTTLDDVATCTDKLLQLDEQLLATTNNSVLGREVLRRGGLEALFHTLPSRAVPPAVVSVTSWIEAKNAPVQVQAQAAFDALTHDRPFSLDAEERAVAEIIEWIEDPTPRVRLLSGSSGTGKTWLLVGLGLRLASRLPTYFVDRPARPRTAHDLATLAKWNDGPTVVLIDDAVENNWTPEVVDSIQPDVPLFVIATTRASARDPDVANLHRYLGGTYEYRALSPLLTTPERRRLSASIRGGGLSRAEEAILKTASVRAAVASLTEGASPIPDVEPLLAAAQNQQVWSWMAPLLASSSNGVRVPERLLRSVAGGPPGALQAAARRWALWRSGPDGDEYWFEDEVCRAALKSIAGQLGDADYDALIEESLSSLIAHVEPACEPERRFLRRVLHAARVSDPRLADELISRSLGKIDEAIRNEDRSALAYAWIRDLQMAGRSPAIREAIEKSVRHLPVPESACDVVLFTELFGSDESAAVLTTLIPDGLAWTLTPWAAAIELIMGLRPDDRREVVTKIRRALSAAPVDLGALLAQRNVAQDLISMTASSGTAQDRKWLTPVVFTLLANEDCPLAAPLHVMTSALDLLERCLMQTRHLEVLALPRQIQTEASTPERIVVLTRELYDRYEVARHREMGLLDRCNAVRTGLDLVRASTTAKEANALLPKLLGFARRWAVEEQRAEVVSLAWHIVRGAIDDGLPARHVETTFLTLVRGGHFGELDEEDRRHLLASLLRFKESVCLESLLHVAMTEAAGLASEGETAALDLMREWLVAGTSLSAAAATRAAAALCFPAAIDWDEVTDRVLRDTKRRASVSYLGAGTLGQCARTTHALDPDCDAQVAEECWEAWHATGRIAEALIAVGLATRSTELCERAMGLLSKNESKQSDNLCVRAAVNARFGQRDAAIALLVQAADRVGRHKGARPAYVHRAYAALAADPSDSLGPILAMAAALSWNGLLPPADSTIIGRS